jgi:hypothetical protein
VALLPGSSAGRLCLQRNVVWLGGHVLRRRIPGCAAKRENHPALQIHREENRA